MHPSRVTGQLTPPRAFSTLHFAVMSTTALLVSFFLFILADGMAEKNQPPSSPDDFPSISWTVEQLRSFLRKHGARLAGKKKELLERYVHDFCDFLFAMGALLTRGFYSRLL